MLTVGVMVVMVCVNSRCDEQSQAGNYVVYNQPFYLRTIDGPGASVSLRPALCITCLE